MNERKAFLLKNSNLAKPFMTILCVHQLSELSQIMFISQEWSGNEIYGDIATLIFKFYFVDHVFISHIACKHIKKSEREFIRGLNFSECNHFSYKEGNSQVQFPSFSGHLN